MTRGKRKRKKYHAKQGVKQFNGNASTIDEPVHADNKAEDPSHGTEKAKAKDHPRRMNRISEAAKRSSLTDWILAVFTAFLALASIHQFTIMGHQLDVMKTDERAWVTVAPKGDIRIDANAPLSAAVIITNSGKTPANTIESHFYIEVIMNGGTPHFEGSAPDMVSTVGSAAPNAPHDVAFSRDARGTLYPLTPEEKTTLERGDAWVAVHGIVWYYDVFKARHWTRYCSFSVFKQGLVPPAKSCSDYNNVSEE